MDAKGAGEGMGISDTNSFRRGKWMWATVIQWKIKITMVKQNVYYINTMTKQIHFSDYTSPAALHFLSVQLSFPIKSHIMETQNLFLQEVSSVINAKV